MNQIFKSRLIRKLKIKHRAVVRTIDFLVSFTLFIILLTQFYLIIINMNLNLAQISTKEENPAQLFADKIFSLPGTQNWGTINGSPQIFGLSSDYQHSTIGYYLDLAKLGRLNGELPFLSINNQYSYIDPQNVVDNLSGSSNNAEFRLTTRPTLQVLVSISSSSTATSSILTVSALDWSNVSLSNINIETYYVLFSTGASILSPKAKTDNGGQATITTTISANTNYIAIVYAHSKDNWGVSWITIHNGVNSISAKGFTSFLLNNPNLNSNSVTQFTNNTISSTQSFHTTTAYENSSNLLYVNSTVLTSTNNVNRALTSVGSSSPLIQVYTMSFAGTDYYRVVSLPLIYDNVNFNFPSTADYSKSQYPVYQTSNFSAMDLSTIYSYTTMTITDRGPILLTLELSIKN